MQSLRAAGAGRGRVAFSCHEFSLPTSVMGGTAPARLYRSQACSQIPDSQPGASQFACSVAGLFPQSPPGRTPFRPTRELGLAKLAAPGRGGNYSGRTLRRGANLGSATGEAGRDGGEIVRSELCRSSIITSVRERGPVIIDGAARSSDSFSSCKTRIRV
jgi:hypothetical protein